MRKLAGTVVAVVLGLGTPAVALAQTSQGNGPNLVLTRARLQELQAAHAAGDPLVVQAWDDAVSAADGYLNVQPDPIRGVLKVPGFYTSKRAQQQQIVRQLRGDAKAAATLAFAFALTGQTDYADQAKAFVLAWVDNLTHAEDGGEWWQVITGEQRGDTPLAISYSFPNFITAWDTLRGLGQVDVAEHARFGAWLRRFVDYDRSEESFENNHHDWQALFLAEAGLVLEDRGLFDRAIGYYRHGMSNNSIARDGAMWRELLRQEKAATYTLMALEAKVQLVVVAEHNGVVGLRDLRAGKRSLLGDLLIRGGSLNLFSSIPVPKDGGTLKNGLDLLRDFVESPRSWDRFQKITRTTSLNGPAAPGDWGWLWEVSNSWWQDPRDQALFASAPYGVQPERAYTLSFATLLFRPLNGAGPIPAPTAAPVAFTAPVTRGRGGVVVNVP